MNLVVASYYEYPYVLSLSESFNLFKSLLAQSCEIGCFSTAEGLGTVGTEVFVFTMLILASLTSC